MTLDWRDRARAVMPGGVNSPVRSFRAVGRDAIFANEASGPYLTTTRGDRLIDLISSWGAVITGHADPVIVEAVQKAAEGGLSFGVSTTAEVELAELIVQRVPSVEVVRMVNSGTEATASAVRVARAATGRDTIVKFEGCYHGHADGFLVKAGSGSATFGTPDSAGVPLATAKDTRVARFNDLASVESVIESAAAVIVEPVAGNMGVVPPEPGFLGDLRRICDDHGALLVFDEVMTGFRVAPGGAQERYGVFPDLTCLGKVVAGGSAAAAYGGRADLMRMVAPEGPVYQAGTLAGNPIAVAAGLACLRQLDPSSYRELERIGAYLEGRLATAIGEEGCVQRVGSMITLFFGPSRVASWSDAAMCDTDRFARFFGAAYDRGVLVPPSQFEAMFLTLAHAEVVEEAAEALVGAIGQACGNSSRT